eukprot:gb/GEZN01011641.1/.p1 GENE.gb/GEZN01011641.1/~~gb/GEZN01011641.1/.p1  ORF type:complete len:214 (+),score=52.15 gb/GEZN01011641.1/:21-662(+)
MAAKKPSANEKDSFAVGDLRKALEASHESKAKAGAHNLAPTKDISSLDDLKKKVREKAKGEQQTAKTTKVPAAALIFKEKDLREYDGKKNPKNPIYLCVKGLVFNVTSSGKYNPDAAYTDLAGRDSSRALALGKTEIKETKLDDLDAPARQSLDEWMKFYWEKYPCVGYIPDHPCLKQKDKQAIAWLEIAKAGQQAIDEDDDDDEETEACSVM